MKHDVPFFHVSHEAAYTAQEAAGKAHVSGNEFGKAVMVKMDGSEVVMCILRASDHIVLDKLAKELNFVNAELCNDEEIKELSTVGTETGAIPPLPDLFGVRAVMDMKLAGDHVIHFKAGSHHELITMHMSDFLKLAKPQLLNFAEQMDVHLKNLTRMMNKCGMRVPHGIIRHAPAMTASETAQKMQIPGLAMLKTVVVKLDGQLAMCAVASTDVIDLVKLSQLARAGRAELATEDELRKAFPDVEVGAMPPFGRLYEMPLYIDAAVGNWPIAGDGDVVFNAGTHTEAMIMRFDDYLKINRQWNEPIIGRFAHIDSGAEHPWTSTHIKHYLQGVGVPFTSIRHSIAYTAPEIAHAAGISGNALAKTVLVQLGDQMAMAVVSASDRVDLEKLSALAAGHQDLGGAAFKVAPEERFRNRFPHVEPGAVPPLGHLYAMHTYVDGKLAAHDVVHFNAGTHKELLRMKWTDYAALVSPVVGDISAPQPHAVTLKEDE